MLQIQSFLLAARGAGLTSEQVFADLMTDYAIKAKRHSEHPNLVLFKYDQIASPFANRIVRECRGIILDENDNWRVVSRAFDKFFNYGEGHAATIDWATARVQEKVDGSLCVLYHYKDKWHVATSGTPDASGNVHGNDVNMTFAELFWRTFREENWSTSGLRENYCYSFELTSPLNRIVVPHAKAHLTMIAMRDLVTQKESPVPYGGKFFVRSFPLQSYEEIERSYESINPLEQEGYVVVDANFNRVKMKHPGYVALHHAKDGMGTKAFIDIVRHGERSEVLVAFPEFKAQFDEISERFNAFAATVKEDYARCSAVVGATQKEFALMAVPTRCSSALFAVRAGKSPSNELVNRDIPADTLMKYLGYKT
jgi:hypothetical protein